MGQMWVRLPWLEAYDQPAMKYQIYQTRDDLLHPLREAARFGAAWVQKIVSRLVDLLLHGRLM